MNTNSVKKHFSGGVIKTKADLKEWLDIEVPYTGLKNKLFPQPQMKFLKALRRFEFHYNNRESICHKLMAVICYYKYYKASSGGGELLYPRILAERD